MPFDYLDKNHLPIQTEHARLKKNILTGKFIAHGFENSRSFVKINHLQYTSPPALPPAPTVVSTPPPIITIQFDEDEIQIVSVETVTLSSDKDENYVQMVSVHTVVVEVSPSLEPSVSQIEASTWEMIEYKEQDPV